MYTKTDWLTLESTSKVLHGILMTYPNNEFIELLKSGDIANEWLEMIPMFPEKSRNTLNKYLNNWNGEDDQLQHLKVDYTNLFIGVGKPLAPLWGSSYTDRHNVLNKDSTLKLKDFLTSKNISITMNANEPIDNLGAIFLIISYIAAQTEKNNKNNELILKELLEHHVLPWGFRCIELIEAHSQTDFYKSVGTMAKSLIDKLVIDFKLNIKEVIIFK